MNNFLELLKKAYYSKKKFEHKSPQRIIIFPFTTHSPKEKGLDKELQSFKGIVGEICRVTEGLQISSEVSLDYFIRKIKDTVKICEKDLGHIRHIIEATVFEENGSLNCFHPIIYPYLSSFKFNKAFKSYSLFVGDVLFGGRKDLLPQNNFEKGKRTLLHSLILDNLPEMDKICSKRSPVYYSFNFKLRDVFQEDCVFLCTDEKLCTKYFVELVKIYTFLYQLITTEHLSFLFKEREVEPFVFSLNWESLSKARDGYREGWQRIERILPHLFSHVHCLELLNYLPIQDISRPFTYTDLKEWTDNADEDKKSEVFHMLEQLIDFYKNGLLSLEFQWKEYENELVSDENDLLLKKAHILWKLIDIQFSKSKNRSSAAKKYSSYIYECASSNFFKKRGRIGNTLAINRDQLMLLTRLCVGHKSELRLKDLWLEFERRYIAFDSKSKQQIITLFEKLNMLDKKSDSGDAQYVRAIF